MNENSNGKTTLIRTILSAVAVIVVILGSLEIIPDMIGLIIASTLLSGASIWNGIESIINGRKKTGIVNLVAGAILIALCITSVFL